MTDVQSAVDEAQQDALSRALTNFKGTVSYEHKVNLGNYESATLGIFVQFDYAPDATPEQFADAARDATNRAKSVVWEGLGLEGYWEGEGVNAVLKLVQHEFPGTVVEVSETAATPAVSAKADVPATPPHDPEVVKAMEDGPVKKAMRRENTNWAKARYEAGYTKEFFDNKAKKAKGEYGETTPDYTHKDTRIGFWDD